MDLTWQVPIHEVSFSMVRAQGPGGQHVNKVSCAVHLRFDIRASSLPESAKTRLLALGDQRVSKEGVVIIKAQSHRSLDKNKSDALARLQRFIDEATRVDPPRKATKPSFGAKQRRLTTKTQRGEIKQGRGKIDW